MIKENQALDSLMAEWCASNIKYSSFQNELTVPGILEEYIPEDFSENESEFVKFVRPNFSYTL